MQNECSVPGCAKCALKDWCDHRLDVRFQELISAIEAVGDPNFVVK